MEPREGKKRNAEVEENQVGDELKLTAWEKEGKTKEMRHRTEWETS